MAAAVSFLLCAGWFLPSPVFAETGTAPEPVKQADTAAPAPDAAGRPGGAKTEGALLPEQAPDAAPGKSEDSTEGNAAAEAVKRYPKTQPVEGRSDVVEFMDAGNGFQVYVPRELELYPLGINPVAVLRGENTRTGVRLAIDASAIDNKGPLMPFQVEAFRSDFLRLVKNSVKDSANDRKIHSSGEVEINGCKAVHVVSSNKTTDGKRRLVRDEYVFVTQNRMFVVMYMMDAGVYPQYSPLIPEWMESVRISEVWKKIQIRNTSFSTEVPASCIDLKEPGEAERTMEVYGNESIMIGLVASPKAQFAFMPATLSGLTPAGQAAVLEGLRKKLAADTKEAAAGYKGEFITLNGQDCVKATYEVNGSKNESYTFLKDGTVLELGFVFKQDMEKAIRPVMIHATEKLAM